MRLKFPLLLLSFGLVLVSCTSLKAKPEKNSGFLPKPELLTENRARAPFHAYWVFNNQEYDLLKDQTKKVYIAPIDTTYAQKKISKASGSEETKVDRIEETTELANYFHEILKINFSKKGQGKIEIVDAPTEDSLNIQLALVSIIPTNPGINFAGTVVGFILPGGGLISRFGDGSIAFEGFTNKVPDQGLILEEFKDRESQKASAFTLKDYQRYAHLRMILEEWTKQIVELYFSKGNHQVSDSLPVSIDPL